MKLLELFAGSRSIGKEAEKRGIEVFSVDWEKYDDIDLSIDIGKMQLSDVPFVPDVIWASPDCTTYSVAAISTHRPKNKPRSDYAIQCDNTNQHWIRLMKEWMKVNPDLVFFIENPRGMMRRMPWMEEFTRHTVWYCKYGETRAKPTDIWTNSTDWVPRPACRNYKYDEFGNIINRHCHHESARRGARTGTQGIKGTYDRSKIPQQLCQEVIESLFKTKT